MPEEFLKALQEYIDKHFEYEYCSRQVDEGGYRHSCIMEREDMEEAWTKVEDAYKKERSKE